MFNDQSISKDGKMKFVFIIGVARTGSKIYRNIINNNTNMNILNELHYISPRWIRKDFISSTKDIRGRCKASGDIEALVDFLYSNQLVGTFWKTEKRDNNGYPNNIAGIEKKQLINSLKNAGLEYGDILRVLIEEHTRNQKRKSVGLNFPLKFHMSLY